MVPTPVHPRAPRRPLPRRLVSALVLALVAAVAALTLAAPAQAAAPSPSPNAPATSSGPAAPVLLVGVTGLRWDDVSTLTTPALWRLSRVGSIGLVAARSVAARSCPVEAGSSSRRGPAPPT